MFRTIFPLSLPTTFHVTMPDFESRTCRLASLFSAKALGVQLLQPQLIGE